MSGYSFYNIRQVLLTMYLTGQQLVNSFVLGSANKKLKSIGISKEIPISGYDWHIDNYYGKPSLL